MTATPPDPLATQHDGTPDPDGQGPVDTQTSRLREENRALRELLAAQVQASLPRHEPGWFKRLCWWLISAPGAALVGWRSLFGRDEGEPITRRSVGCAALTVLYTLAIYGALVLLVVSWNSPSTATSGSTAASPVRVPLTPRQPLPPEVETAGKGAASTTGDAQAEKPSDSASPTAEPLDPAAPRRPDRAAGSPTATATAPSTPAATQPAPPVVPERATPPASSKEPAPAGPQSTLRITEIPAPDPMAWVAVLDGELARCAELGFFERPDCAWTARKQYCEPNQGWGKVKECPGQP